MGLTKEIVIQTAFKIEKGSHMNSIKENVHTLYWEKDENCAKTMLLCLGELFQIEYLNQTLTAAIGLHGAGGYRAQCGLVEGALMFIGIYFSRLDKSEETIASICYNFADTFNRQFGSLRCFDLRPSGFTSNDPPHMCEQLTCDAVTFAYNFILDNTNHGKEGDRLCSIII